MNKINELKTLYAQSSKHSNYQVLSRKIASLIGDNIEVKTRHEVERLNFILENIDVNDKNILDIGGNSGFFSFELIENGARHVEYYEGNKAHSDFVKLASEVTDVSKKINVVNKYLNFENELDGKHFDITLLLNVLHHLGDDYGEKDLTLEIVKKNILKQLNSLADKTSILVFQLGFNWKGKRNQCLFENGTKKELIDFVLGGIRKYWEVLKIGIAAKENDKSIYHELNEKNIIRDDSLGEFRNRPIFILKSKTSKFNRDEELKFLDSLVSDYKDELPYSKIKKDIILNLIRNNITDNENQTALQLGCSNGYETSELTKLFKDLFVVDGSLKFLEKLRMKHSKIHIQHSLFEEINNTFKNKKFDIIICNYILEHVFDSVQILNNLKKLLNPNGRIFIVVPNANALSRRIALHMGLIKDLMELTQNDILHGHRRVYNIENLKKDIKMADLEIVSIKGVIFKILADFQLNELLAKGFLTENHITALQELSNIKENMEYSDSIFAELK